MREREGRWRRAGERKQMPYVRALTEGWIVQAWVAFATFYVLPGASTAAYLTSRQGIQKLQQDSPQGQ